MNFNPDVIYGLPPLYFHAKHQHIAIRAKDSKSKNLTCGIVSKYHKYFCACVHICYARACACDACVRIPMTPSPTSRKTLPGVTVIFCFLTKFSAEFAWMVYRGWFGRGSQGGFHGVQFLGMGPNIGAEEMRETLRQMADAKHLAVR